MFGGTGVSLSKFLQCSSELRPFSIVGICSSISLGDNTCLPIMSLVTAYLASSPLVISGRDKAGADTTGEGNIEGIDGEGSFLLAQQECSLFVVDPVLFVLT